MTAADKKAGAEAAGRKGGKADGGGTDLSGAWRNTIQRESRTVWHGEASIVVDKDDNTRWISVKASTEVELMIRRLVKDSSGASPVLLPAHSDNAKLVRMVAGEYPLKMGTPRMWAEMFDEIAGEERRAVDVMSLDQLDPPKAVFMGTLMSHQREGLDYMEKCGGCCLLADEMGLGKTVETLAYLAGRPDAYPVVIVAPLVTVTHWVREIRKFLRVDRPCTGQIDAARLEGGGGGGGNKREKNKTEQRQEPRTPVIELIRAGRKPWKHRVPRADFYVINYDLVGKWVDTLAGLGPKTVVFDEIQALRINTSLRYGACRRLALSYGVAHRIGLSGTPVYNNRGELHNISEVLRPGVLGSREEFGRRWPRDPSWLADEDRDEDEKEDVPSIDRRSLELTTMLRRRFMLRRLKADVLDLPEKIRLHQEIEIDTGLYEREIGRLLGEISAACRRLEMDVESAEGDVGCKDGDAAAAAGAGLASVDSNAVEGRKKSGLMELNQRLVQMRVAERQIAGISKAGKAAKYIRTLLEDYADDKVVVFCHHRSVREILRMDLKRFGLAEIAGGQKASERQAEIDRFQGDGNCRVMIAGLRAGNVGISLSAASYVIFAELDWSPSVHRQAEDRLHRIGQKRQVVCHYLIGKDTYDEEIANTVVRKTLDISGVMNEPPGRVDTKAALELLAERYGQKAVRLASGGRLHGAQMVSVHAKRILDGMAALKPAEGDGDEDSGGGKAKETVLDG